MTHATSHTREPCSAATDTSRRADDPTASTPERTGASRRSPLDGPRSLHQVLILLAAFLFGGGDASLTERTAALFDDAAPAARAAAVGVAERIDAATDAHAAQLVEARRALHDVLRRAHFEEAELRAALQQGADAAARFETQLLDLRFELRDTVDAEQWSELFPAGE